jgi:hypothetical protein
MRLVYGFLMLMCLNSSVFAKDCSAVVENVIVDVMTAAGKVFGASNDCIAVTRDDILYLSVKYKGGGVYTAAATLPRSCGTEWQVEVIETSCFVKKIANTYLE